MGADSIKRTQRTLTTRRTWCDTYSIPSPFPAAPTHHYSKRLPLLPERLFVEDLTTVRRCMWPRRAQRPDGWARWISSRSTLTWPKHPKLRKPCKLAWWRLLRRWGAASCSDDVWGVVIRESVQMALLSREQQHVARLTVWLNNRCSVVFVECMREVFDFYVTSFFSAR